MKSILCIVALLALATAEYPSYGTPAYLNDNNVLQYALTLENLEAAFYTQGLAQFNQSTFAAAGISATAYSFLGTILSHEQTHVTQLGLLLQSRGVVPVKPCNYTFTYADVPSFIALARALEETGVRAYDGAITLLTQTDLVSLAGTVATVEARHASFLNTLNTTSPFPNALDVANNVSTIFGQAGVFFNGACVYLTNVTSATYTVSDAFRNVTGYVGSPASINDLNVLNYALTLETLEAHFYNVALQNISAATFNAVGIKADTQALLATIQGHENYHVAFLRSFLSANGGNPVGNCSAYKFDANLTNDATGIAYFIATGVLLENGGVAAYLGALPYLTSEALIQVAATIVTVEARHAAFLQLLADAAPPASSSPFPNAFDPTATPSTILLGVLPLFASGCPTVPQLILADNYRANNTNKASSSSSSSSASSTSASTSTASSSGSVTGTMTGTKTTSGSTGSGTATGTMTGSRSSSATRTVTGTTTATAHNSDASVVAVSVALLAALALVF